MRERVDIGEKGERGRERGEIVERRGEGGGRGERGGEI